jgi:hypothetical protein
LTEKGWPESRFCAWNILATARTINGMLRTISPAATTGCHHGMPPTTSRLTKTKGRGQHADSK